MEVAVRVQPGEDGGLCDARKALGREMSYDENVHRIVLLSTAYSKAKRRSRIDAVDQIGFNGETPLPLSVRVCLCDLACVDCTAPGNKFQIVVWRPCVQQLQRGRSL